MYPQCWCNRDCLIKWITAMLVRQSQVETFQFKSLLINFLKTSASCRRYYIHSYTIYTKCICIWICLWPNTCVVMGTTTSFMFFFFADGSILMINFTCVGAGHRLISHGKWSSTIYKKKIIRGAKGLPVASHSIYCPLGCLAVCLSSSPKLLRDRRLMEF